jgi:hypothetical protein
LRSEELRQDAKICIYIHRTYIIILYMSISCMILYLYTYPWCICSWFMLSLWFIHVYIPSFCFNVTIHHCETNSWRLVQRMPALFWHEQNKN